MSPRFADMKSDKHIKQFIYLRFERNRIMAYVRFPLTALAPFAITVVIIAASGCGFVPGSRLSQCNESFRELTEKNEAIETELANLDAHNRKTSDQLSRAEEELVSLDQQLRATEDRLANYENERSRLYRRFGRASGKLPQGIGDQLEKLSRKYPSLHYDPTSGISKLDTDVLFGEAEAELAPDTRRMLTEFATILLSPEASNLRLMIAGHTDDRRIAGEATRDAFPNNWHLSAGRALTVADFLRANGIDSSRMGVAGFGSHQPIAANSTPGNRQKNRRVEVFLVAPDVPVVGWTETLTTIYR